MFEKLIPYDVSHLILGEYFNYYHRFQRITKRAKIRFEHRDWHGIQSDARERIAQYRLVVGDIKEKIQNLLAEYEDSPRVWLAIKQHFEYDIANFNTKNIAETFYNSVFRHYHKGVSIDEELMFVHATSTYREFRSTIPIFNVFQLDRSPQEIFHEIMETYKFDVPYEDLERDISYLSQTYQSFLNLIQGQPHRLEILKSIFFRNKGAYIVGRIFHKKKIYPFIVPLLNEENGIYADTLLFGHNDVSTIFSYNRTYFLVEVDIVKETIDFLLTILPTKSTGELYNSLGFEKHGKTVIYREFFRHLDKTTDKFTIAPGIQGMVMFVFTLPSYNMVFKVIRDRFAPPKNVTEAEVKRKYEMVNLHDRVGRMTDSHMFQNLVLSRDRFEEETLNELLETAPSKIITNDNDVEIQHVYIEKKMLPLDLYLHNATLDEAETVIDDYGKAIKQLASVNIFPGDMLLKNFGVTRLERVVFYDYDEIGFLTDFNFRRIPQPRNFEDELSSDPYFHVSTNDIFPEEFPKFLIGFKQIRDIFFRLHGDLYDVKFWREMQKKIKNREIVDVFPYNDQHRFTNRFATTQAG